MGCEQKPAQVSPPIQSEDNNIDKAITNSQSNSIAEESKEKQPIKTSKLYMLEYGQNLTSLLSEHGFTNKDSYYLAKAVKPYKPLEKLQIKQPIKVEFEGGEISTISFASDFDKQVIAKRTDSNWQAEQQVLKTTAIKRFKSANIQDSFYLAADKNSVPVTIISQAITAFSHLVDFQRQIHKGDSVEFYYTELLLDENSLLHTEKSRAQDLIYIRLTQSQTDKAIYRQQQKDSHSGFYFADGTSAQSFLLKTPLNGARLSSYYGKRKHPILGYTRLHAGIDFGAPTGTPIFASGHGEIVKATWSDSFGNHVIIEHLNGYRTLYAHLKGFAKKLKRGVRVEQGQVIGFLGNTGLSQARHLHYEVHKNGTPINPLKLKSSNKVKLIGASLDAFKNQVKHIDLNIEELKTNDYQVNNSIKKWN